MAYQGWVAPGVYRTSAKEVARFRATVTRIFDSLEAAQAWRAPLLVQRVRKFTKPVSISFTPGFLRAIDSARGVLTRPELIRKLALPLLGRYAATPSTDYKLRKRLVMWLHEDLLSVLDEVRGVNARGRYLEALLTPELSKHVKC